MTKRTKKVLKIGGGVALAIGAVYFAAGVAYTQWHGYDWWSKTAGTAPGPWDFGQPGDDPSDAKAAWWSYLIGRRSEGAFLSFNTNSGNPTVAPLRAKAS